MKDKTANSLEIYDMSGNVWEWCLDWNSTVSTSTPATGSASGSYRVIRGGSWSYDASYCAVSYLYNHGPFYREDYLGFRVVRNAQ